MARISDNDYASDWSVGGIKRRDFQHSHDGPEEMPHRRKRGKQSPRKKPGCPANEGRAHVYVWIKYHARYKQAAFGPTGESRWIDSTWHEHECVGCGKIGNRRYLWGEPSSSDGIEIYEEREVSKPWYH